MKKKLLIIITFIVLLVISICLFMFLNIKSNDDLKQNTEDKKQTETKNDNQAEKENETPIVEEEKETTEKIKHEETKDTKEQKQEQKKESKFEQKVSQTEQKQEIQPVQNQEPVVDTKQKARDYIFSYGVKYFTSQSSAQSYLNSIPADIRTFFSVSSRTYKCSVTVTPITDEYGGEGYTSDYYYDAGTYNWFGPKQSINLDGQTTSFIDYCDSHYGLRDSEESKSYTTTFYKVDIYQ